MNHPIMLYRLLRVASMRIAVLVCCLLCIANCLGVVSGAHAGQLGPLDYTTHRLGNGKGPTLMVVGGIQGDEPGGFTAASLLATRYTITHGNVWVAPNLSFPSIILCTRGFHGDMNRKFAALAPNDPDYKTIKTIKKTILDPQVDVVLNLHDGSGFYRPTPINTRLHPRRWGQSIIIDQEHVDIPRYGNLGEMARHVTAEVNRRLLQSLHVYHVKNTRTRLGDREMEKTLTYFAITHGKAAFGVEASKDIPHAQRTYYHLLAMEAFMHRMGISFTRNFPLTLEDVTRVINDDISVAFYDNRIFLDLKDIRRNVNYFPLKKDADMPFRTSNPLITVVGSGTSYTIYHGNKVLTRLKPQYFEFDHTLQAVKMDIDGETQDVAIGQMVGVTRDFKVHAMPGVRVNIIGYAPPTKRPSEHGITLAKSDILPRFSLDAKGDIFRVEFYKGKKFAGMILVNYLGKPASLPIVCTARVLSSPTHAGR